MEEKLKWQFELIDMVSGNASKIERALGRIEKALQSGGVKVTEFERSLTKASKAGGSSFLEGTLGPIGAFMGGLTQVAGAAWNVASAVVGIGSSFIEAGFNAMAFKETTITSFKAMFHDQKKADDMWTKSVVLADLTPMGTNDVVGQMQSIMGAGFKGKAADDLFAALSDVSAMSGGGAAAMQGMLTQIAQGKSVGFHASDLKIMMSWAARAGMGTDDLYEQLSKQTGFAKALIPGMIGSQQIKADDIIYAFEKTVQDKVSGGALGSVTLAQSQSLGGLMSTIGSLGEKAYAEVPINLPGIKALKGNLSAFIDLMSAALSPGGKLNDLMVRIVGTFAEWGSKVDVVKLVDGIVWSVDMLWQGFEAVAAAGDEFMTALDPYLKDLGPTFADAFGTDSVKQFGSSLAFVAEMAGHAVGILLELIMLPQRLAMEVKGMMVALGLRDVPDTTKADAAAARALGVSAETIAMYDPSSPEAKALNKAHAMALQPEGPMLPPESRTIKPSAITFNPAAVQGGKPHQVNIEAPVTVHAGAANAEGVARHLEELLPNALGQAAQKALKEIGGGK